jgi:hypothetical protein
MGPLPALLLLSVLLLNLFDGANAVFDDNRSRSNPHANKAELDLLATLNPSTWPEHGPWIVEIAPGAHDTVLAHARTLGRNFVSNRSFKADGGFNGITARGLTREELLAIPGVVEVHIDGVARTQISWGLDRIDQQSLPLVDRYVPGYRGCGVDVYIIDTGIDTTHAEFNDGVNQRSVQNIWTAFEELLANNDDNGHGTHVAGTVGGKTVGVAPCANIYGLKALAADGSGFFSDILAAMDEVKYLHSIKPNAKSVLSMSLGASCSGGCKKDLMVRKIAELAGVGVISSVAAGNEAADAGSTTPAAAPEAVTVASTDSNDYRSYFSNYGKIVDINAPGRYILSACSSLSTNCDANGMLTLSGTSMATPHVSGALALVLEMQDIAMNSQTSVTSIRNVLVSLSVNKVMNAVKGTSLALLQVPKTAGLAVCFKELDGTNQVEGSRNACSGYSSASFASEIIRDNNDDRPGGISLQWGLMANQMDTTPGTEYRLCFNELEGSDQCGGVRNSCTEWASKASTSVTYYTSPFRTTTDNRPGGCKYSWSMEQRRNTQSTVVTTACRLWFQETEGSSGCLGNRGPSYSSWSDSTFAYTPVFTSKTGEGTGGGCTMQWGLQCK